MKQNLDVVLNIQDYLFQKDTGFTYLILIMLVQQQENILYLRNKEFSELSFV